MIMLQSMYCAHVNERGQRALRDECRRCNRAEYRCLYCYQEEYERIWVTTKCDLAPRGPKGGKGKHKVSIDGRDAVCELCHKTTRLKVLKRDEDGLPMLTDCTLSSGHEMSRYPFRCEACDGAVSVERMTECVSSYDGRHLLRSGFIGEPKKRIAPIKASESVRLEVDSLLAQLKADWRHRRFVWTSRSA